MTMGYKVHLQNASKTKNIPNKRQFNLWVNAALVSQITDAELAIRIVTEEESAQLNQQYRGKTGPTNVLSFPLKKHPGMHVHHLGDLVICASLVEQEAQQQHKTVIAHWAHLVIHGILHLLGHDHVHDDEAQQMEKLEITLLNALGYANPYQMK